LSDVLRNGFRLLLLIHCKANKEVILSGSDQSYNQHILCHIANHDS
jgi:hypothetical protein